MPRLEPWQAWRIVGALVDETYLHNDASFFGDRLRANTVGDLVLSPMPTPSPLDVQDYIRHVLSAGRLELSQARRWFVRFVGAVLTGSGGDWILRRACIVCDDPHDLRRCVLCQATICEEHAELLGQAGQDESTREWQGASLRCCKNTFAC